MRPIEENAAPDGSFDALFSEVLERIESEGAQALEDVCREHPERAALLRRRVLKLREVGLIESWTTERPPQRLGDFRLLERIGSGGMGVVYHAVQESLGREVALKLIRPEMLHLPSARERFARETTIIGRLQHPGIVPIYTVGSVDDLPYYAMERVPGCTLAEALAELVDKPVAKLTGADLALAVKSRSTATESNEPNSALFAGSWEQTVLRIIRQIAEALEHAHSRGVLHRDLKPSNVMITPGGRVMLVDFGLSQSEGSDSITKSGERAGSLPYMPPELLKDGVRAVDKRSDVYSLGVTLYQLLTLHLPFEGESEPKVLMRILEGRPRSPRALAPATSWEAETVCLVAMELDPDRRYATAADFARDLGHALERRPVEARRASAWLRTRRWIERRPAATAAIVLALLLPTVIAVQQQSKARRIGEALDVARRQESLANTNFERALRAVDSMLRRVGTEQLDHVPGVDGLRMQLVTEAQTLYGELALERPEDAALAHSLAECGLVRAKLLRRKGAVDDAHAVVNQALAQLEPWLTRGAFEPRLSRARCMMLLATWADDLQESAALHAAALDALFELRRERPDDHEVAAHVVDTLSAAVMVARTSGDRASAEATLAVAEQLARELVERSDAPYPRTMLARVLAVRAWWLQREGRSTDALAPMQESLMLRRRLLAETPSDERVRADIVQAASALAGMLMSLRRESEALEELLYAAREAECNVADYPDIVEFASNAADVALNLGAAYGRLKREPEARAATERAAELLEGILTRTPDDSDLHQMLGTTLLNLSDSQLSAGDTELALATCARSLEHFQAALALKPGHPDYAAWLAPERSTRAKILLALGRTAEAAEALAEAPRLAGHLPDRAVHALKRLLVCLERAREDGDAQTQRRCDAAARAALELASARGDLDLDPTVARLRELLIEH